MNIIRLSRLLILLLLLMLFLAPHYAAANTIHDSADRTWRSNSIEQNGHKQVRIDITDGTGQVNSYFATPTDINSIDAFLYCDQDEVWLVWSQERTNYPGTFDIYQRQLHVDGTLNQATQVTKFAGSEMYSDHRPAAAICPMGHHIAFQRETTTEFGTRRVITYMSNIFDSWINATVHEIDLLPGRDGTEATLLLGNDDYGSPQMLVFKEWVTQHLLSGLSTRKAHISLWSHETDSSGDPNPWEKITVKLPDNPEQD